MTTTIRLIYKRNKTSYDKFMVRHKGHTIFAEANGLERGSTPYTKS